MKVKLPGGSTIEDVKEIRVIDGDRELVITRGDSTRVQESVGYAGIQVAKSSGGAIVVVPRNHNTIEVG